MPLISFTSNYRDCSTDNGYQFEFICDGCGNGYMSRFKESKIGMAGNMLRAAGGFLGGALMGGAAEASDQVREALRGRARDEAFAEAVEEAKKVFRQCGRCGNWVCPEACWNNKMNQCDSCSPEFDDELASAQATAQKEQLLRAARNANMLEGIDITKIGGGSAATAPTPAPPSPSTSAGTSCPSCQAPNQTGKFCASCGTPLPTKTFCGNCGAQGSPGAKFCSSCGTKFG